MLALPTPQFVEFLDRLFSSSFPGKILAAAIKTRSTGFAVMLIAIGIFSSRESLLAQTARDLLTQLQFENSGTVTRDMDFRYFGQPDDYLETPDSWNIRSQATYLYRVDGG